MIDLITGYRLVRDRYRPILPEEDGRMHLQTVSLYISLRNGKVVLEDAATGERLLTIEEMEASRIQSEQRAQQAEQRAQAEAEARVELEAQLVALRAELARLKTEPPVR